MFETIKKKIKENKICLYFGMPHNDDAKEIIDEVLLALQETQELVSMLCPAIIDKEQFKMSGIGNHFLPYVEKGIAIAEHNPELLSNFQNIEKYKGLYELYEVLNLVKMQEKLLNLKVNILQRIVSIELRKQFDLEYGTISELSRQGVELAFGPKEQLAPAYSYITGRAGKKTKQYQLHPDDCCCEVCMKSLIDEINELETAMEHGKKINKYKHLEQLKQKLELKQKLLELEQFKEELM